MINIVEQLRAGPYGNRPAISAQMREGADTIERLQRELAEARAEAARLRSFNEGLAKIGRENEAEIERLRAARGNCECGAALSQTCPTCQHLWQS